VLLNHYCLCSVMIISNQFFFRNKGTLISLKMGNFTQLFYGWILKQLMASFQRSNRPNTITNDQRPRPNTITNTDPARTIHFFLTQFQRTRPKNTQIKLYSFFLKIYTENTILKTLSTVRTSKSSRRPPGLIQICMP